MQEYKPKGRRPCQRLETKRNEDIAEIWELNWQREFMHVALLLHNKIGIVNHWQVFPFWRTPSSIFLVEGDGSWSVTQWIEVEIEEVDLQQYYLLL